MHEWVAHFWCPVSVSGLFFALQGTSWIMYLLLGHKNLYACCQLDYVKEYLFDFDIIFNFE